jgi:undecaprenyl-diphosphatase
MATPASRRRSATDASRRPITPTVARSAVDVSHLIAFLSVLSVGLLAAAFAPQTASGVAADLARAAAQAPPAVVSFAAVIAQVALLLVALGAPAGLVLTGRGRVAGIGAVAVAAGAGLFALVAALLPLGVGVVLDVGDDVVVVPGVPRVPSAAAVAAFTAGATVVTSELSRRWARALWLILAFVAATQVVTAAGTPLGVVLAVGLGGAVGSLVLLAFGRRVEPVTAFQVNRALGRAGLEVTRVERLEDPAWPDWTLRVVTRQGVLAARTIGVREQRSDTLYRRYRRIRLKDVGDDEPYPSPRRAAAAEAMMSLLAARSGVRCPALRAVEPIGAEEFLVAVDHVPARPLSELGDTELGPEVLADAWRQVDGLRRAGIAHRDLRLSQFLLDGAGRVWIRDFAFGEPAASTGGLEGDVAELLAGTYTRVGAETAVSAATRVLPPAVLAGALARLVPAALTRPTRAALKTVPGGLDPLVAEVCRVTGVSEPVFVQVERLRPRTVVVGVTVAVAVYVLLPQLADLPGMLQAIRGADWRWIPAVVGASVLTYVGAALGLAGGTPGRVPVGRTLLVALSSSFVVLVAPGAIGQVGLNVRFLQKRGYSTSVAISASAAKETAVFVVHLLLLATFALWVGSSDVLTGEWEELPPAGALLAVLGTVLGLTGLVLAFPGARRWLKQTVVPAGREALGAMAEVAASPGKMVMLFSGVALLPLGYAACLYASVAAFGGGASFPAVALVFLSVGALAAAAPTPGGLGAVEAVLLAALTGVGIAPPEALAAVFLYRLATFWGPIAPGFVSFRWLTAREVL